MAKSVYVEEAGGILEFPDSATPQQMRAYIERTYRKPLPTPVPEEEVGAFTSGLYGTLGKFEAAGGKAAQAAGLESLADYLFRESRESQEYAAKYRPDVSDISQISGPTDVAKFAGSTIAQSAPETAVGVGGALVGRAAGTALGGAIGSFFAPGPGTVAGSAIGGNIGMFVGSAIASLPSFVGSNLQRQVEEQNIPLEEASGFDASVGAAFQAPIDAAFEVLIARKLPGSGVAADAARKSFLSEVARTAGQGMATEALTEPAQQAIELAQANPEKLREFSPEVQFELLNAAAAGALAGGVIGGGAGALGTIGRPTESDIVQKEISETLAESQQRGVEMQRSAQINMGVEKLSNLPSIGRLNLQKIRIDRTPENKLTAPIVSYRMTDANGKTIADFSDPVLATEAVNQYKKLSGQNITLTNIETGSEIPTVKAAKGVKGKVPAKKATQAPATEVTPVRPTAGLGAVPGAVPTPPSIQTPPIQAVTPPEQISTSPPRPAGIAAARPTVSIDDVSGAAPTIPSIDTPSVEGVATPEQITAALPSAPDTAIPQQTATPSVAEAGVVKTDVGPSVDLKASKIFKTAKGSVYTLYGDGSTVRDKSYHPEHGKDDVGIKEKSEKTYFIRPEDARNLDIVVAEGHSGTPIIAEYEPGKIGVKYINGKYAGKFIDGTITKTFSEPEVGLSPFEVWGGGRKIHFGNKITEVSDPEISEAIQAEPSTPAPQEATLPQESPIGFVGTPDVAAGIEGIPAIEAAPVVGVNQQEVAPDIISVTPEVQQEVRRKIEDRTNRIAEEVRNAMARYNLKDVQVKFVPAFLKGMRIRTVLGEAGLSGEKSFIRVATGVYDPDLTVEQMVDKVMETMNHETVHSLLDLGLIRPTEMQILINAARNTRMPGKRYTYEDYVRALYDPSKPGVSKIYREENNVLEEAVAELFKNWRKGDAGVPKNSRGLINRVVEVLRRMFNSMKRESYEDIFKDIESGRIGERPRDVQRAKKQRFSSEIDDADSRVNFVPEDPRLSVAPVYPYGQRVPQVNAEQTNRVIGEVEHGAFVNRVAKFLNNKTLSTVVPERYRPSEAGITEFMQKWADRILPLGQMVDFIKQNGGTVPDALDTYMVAQLSQSITANNLETREENLYKPLIEFINSSGLSLQRFEDYLYAKHAKERNARIRGITKPRIDEETGLEVYPDPSFGSGMSDAEADEILASIDSSTRKRAYLQAEALFRKIIDDTNQLRVESGLSPDFGTMMLEDEDGNPVAVEQYDFYAPLRGFADESSIDGDVDQQIMARTGQGFKIRGREDRRALGRTSKASDIIAHAMLQNSEAVVRAEKNKVGLSFLELIEANPEIASQYGVEVLEKGKKPLKKFVNSKGVVQSMVDPMYKNRDDVFVVKREGIEIPIKLDNRLLQKALITNRSADPAANGKFVRALGRLNRFIAAMNTVYNPEFALVNFPRDIQQALINISQYEIDGIKKKILKDSLPAARGAWSILRDPEAQNEWSNWYKMFREDGGNTSGFYGAFSVEEQINKIEKISADMSGSTKSRAIKAFESMKKLMEDYNGAFENAIRLSVYKNVVEAGGSRQKAAFIAKNITVNFDQRGEFGPIMNSLYLFYNASVQGTLTLFTAAARSKKVRKALGGLVVFGILQDQINSLMSGEGEDDEPLYDKLPDYKLENNIILMDPFGITSKGYIAIPLAYGANAFVNLGRSMSRNFRGKYTTGETVTSIGSTFIDAFNPVGGTESFLNFVVPTALDPVVALSMNMDYSGRRIYPEAFPGSIPKADSQTYFSSTSPVAKTVAQFLNEATGGSEYVPGYIDLSPDVMEYVFDYILGATGATLRRTIDTTTSELPKVLAGDFENIEFNNVPIIRKVYGEVSERMSYEDYFDKVNHVLMRGEELKFAIKQGDPERVREVRKKFADELKIYPMIKTLANRRNSLASALRKIRENEKLPPEVKRQRQDAIQKQIESITERVDKLYGDAIGKKYPGLFS